MGKQFASLVVFTIFISGMGFGATLVDGPSKLVFYAVYVFLSLAFLALGFGGMYARRKINDMSPSKISTAPQGLVSLEGFIWGTEYVLDPEDSLYAAVYWEVRQEGSKNQSTLLAQGSYPEQFIIHDDTGSVLVENKVHPRAEGPYHWYHMNPNQKELVLKWVSPSSEIGKKLQTENLDFGIYWSGHKLGEPILAEGIFKSSSKSSVNVLSGLKKFLEKFNELKSNPNLLDTNRDQRVNMEEMVRGHTKFALEIAKNSLAQGSSTELVQTNGILEPGQSGQVHLMSSNKKTILSENMIPMLWAYGIIGAVFMTYAVLLPLRWLGLPVLFSSAGMATMSEGCKALNTTHHRVRLGGANSNFILTENFNADEKIKIKYERNGSEGSLGSWWRGPDSVTVIVIAEDTESGETPYVAAPEGVRAFQARLNGALSTQDWLLTMECTQH